LASATHAEAESARAAELKTLVNAIVAPPPLVYPPEVLSRSSLARDASAANLAARAARADAILKADVVPNSTYRADAIAYSDECSLKETEAKAASTDADARAEESSNARDNAIAAATSSDAVAASQAAVEAARLAGIQEDLAEAACIRCQSLASDAWLSDTSITNANAATEQALALAAGLAQEKVLAAEA
jgi:hypothetical protein